MYFPSGHVKNNEMQVKDVETCTKLWPKIGCPLSSRTRQQGILSLGDSDINLISGMNCTAPPGKSMACYIQLDANVHTYSQMFPIFKNVQHSNYRRKIKNYLNDIMVALFSSSSNFIRSRTLLHMTLKKKHSRVMANLTLLGKMSHMATTNNCCIKT